MGFSSERKCDKFSVSPGGYSWVVPLGRLCVHYAFPFWFVMGVGNRRQSGWNVAISFHVRLWPKFPLRRLPPPSLFRSVNTLCPNSICNSLNRSSIWRRRIWKHVSTTSHWERLSHSHSLSLTSPIYFHFLGEGIKCKIRPDLDSAPTNNSL